MRHDTSSPTPQPQPTLKGGRAMVVLQHRMVVVNHRQLRLRVDLEQVGVAGMIDVVGDR